MHLLSPRDLLPAATKLGQGNVFTSVCLSTGGEGVCLSACWNTPPDQAPLQSRHTPPDQAPPLREQTHPGPGLPQSRPPRPDTPQEQTPPLRDQAPPLEAHCSIRLTSGRYASYWNTFLFPIVFTLPTLCEVITFKVILCDSEISPRVYISRARVPDSQEQESRLLYSNIIRLFKLEPARLHGNSWIGSTLGWRIEIHTDSITLAEIRLKFQD